MSRWQVVPVETLESARTFLRFVVAMRLLSGWKVVFPEAKSAPELDPVIGDLGKSVAAEHLEGLAKGSHKHGIVALSPSGSFSEAFLLFDAGADSVIDRVNLVTEVTLGEPLGHLIMVPGSGSKVRSSGTAGTEYLLDQASVDRLRWAEAEQTSRRRVPRSMVVFSGWSPPNVDRYRSEAEQLFFRKGNRDYLAALDPAARTTAENLVNAAQLSRLLGNIPKVTVVASWSNATRIRLIAEALNQIPSFSGVEFEVCAIGRLGHLRFLRPGIFGIFKIEEHLDWALERLDSVGFHHRRTLAPDTDTET